MPVSCFRLFATAALAIAVLSAGCSTTRHLAITDEFPKDFDSFALNRVRVGLVRDGNLIEWGSGFLLAHGYVLTSAHVVDTISLNKTIEIDHFGSRVRAHVTAIGDRATRDVAVLKLDAPLVGKAVTPPTVCTKGITPGAPLIVVTAIGIVRTFGSPADVVVKSGFTGSQATTTRFGPGASGSAVIDLEHHCIAGVVSRERSTTKSMTSEGMTIKSFDQKSLISDAQIIGEIISQIPDPEFKHGLLAQ